MCVVPSRTTNFGRCSFAYASSTIWNCLPLTLRQSSVKGTCLLQKLEMETMQAMQHTEYQDHHPERVSWFEATDCPWDRNWWSTSIHIYGCHQTEWMMNYQNRRTERGPENELEHRELRYSSVCRWRSTGFDKRRKGHCRGPHQWKEAHPTARH